jgi:hypothetical protein
MFERKKRIAMLVGGAAIALALSAGTAFAVFPNDSVTHYTGCLNTNASPGGTFSNVAVGETPAKACGSGQVLVHLSGGDITAVQTASGSGLTGGKDNGAASLALDSTGCSSGGVLKWNGTIWACGSDNTTSYSAGTGLDLTGTTFSVKSGYQLPQSCNSGEIPKSDGNGGWSCQSDATGSLPGVWTGSNQNVVDISDRSSGVDIVSVSLPAGSYLLIAKGTMQDTTADESDGCDLVGPGQTIDHSDWFQEANSGPLPFSLTGVVRLSSPGTVTLHCGTGAQLSFQGVADARLVAEQIGTINY